MTSLWADAWFYISGGGFLVSCALFVFLLGQYRAAVEAEGESEEVLLPPPAQRIQSQRIVEPEPAPAPAPAPITAPAPKPQPRAVPVAMERPAPERAPVASAQPPQKKAENSTTGASPAVVYLQNLKTQMEHMDKEISGLIADFNGLKSRQENQNELILKQLAQLAEEIKRAPARQELAAAEQQEAAPEPAAEESPEPLPEPEAIAVEETTMVIEPTVAVQKFASTPPPPTRGARDVTSPPPEADETLPEILPQSLITPTPKPEPEEKSKPYIREETKPSRKGPVWPI